MRFGAGQSRLDCTVLLLTTNSLWFKTSWSILDWPAQKCTFTVSMALLPHNCNWRLALFLSGQVSDARHRGTPYRGMLHCWRTVASEEGIRALYSGLAPALMRQVPKTYRFLPLGLPYRDYFKAISRKLVYSSISENLYQLWHLVP